MGLTRAVCVGLAVAALGYAALRWWARRRAERLIREWPDRRRTILAEAAEAFGQVPADPTIVVSVPRELIDDHPDPSRER